MAGGGQKGAGVVGEAFYVMVGVFVAGFAVGAVGCGGGGSSETDKANQECEQAYYEQNDGDGEAPESAILEQQWCIDHNDAMRSVAQIEERQRVQDATQEATP